jgi:hypothetical protein
VTVFDKLSHDLKQAAVGRFQELQAPDTGGVEGLPLAIPLAGAAAIAIRRLIMSRLGNQLARRLTGSLIGRALGRAATYFAISPGKYTGFGVLFDVGVSVVTLLAMIVQGGQTTRDALKEKLDQWYQTEIRLPLVEKSNVDVIVTGALEGVEEQLRHDRDAAANLIERTYAGVIAQTKSPGFAEFSAHSDDENLSSATFAVPSVFGTEHVEVDYAVKLDLVHRITPVDKARLLVQRHGRRFIDLFRAYPGDVAERHGRRPILRVHPNGRFARRRATLLPASHRWARGARRAADGGPCPGADASSGPAGRADPGTRARARHRRRGAAGANGHERSWKCDQDRGVAPR